MIRSTGTSHNRRTAWARQSLGKKHSLKSLNNTTAEVKQAYDYLRSEYGIKHPYFVINRIKECGKYLYDAETDHFSGIDTCAANGIFMDLDEFVYERGQFPIIGVSSP